MKIWAVLVATAALSSACAASPPAPPQVGYLSRACGFDLDFDGRVGEPGECSFCDGRTTDPDADGVSEDLLYVDCQAGLDVATCGQPGTPCRTLEFAFNQRADGPADGAEEIICFRGSCTPENLKPRFGGLAGSATLRKSGSAARDFELPKNPLRLIGWDADGDGSYPPHDPDDIAVLDGGGDQAAKGLSRAFELGEENSFLEMAHFTVRDYGRFSSVEESGFIRFGVRGGLRADALSFHDLALEGINRDQPAQSHRIVFNYFTSGTRFHHVAFVNLLIKDAGGFMVRGSGPDRPGTEAEGGNDGPLRWQNLTVSAHGCDDSDPSCREGGGSAFIGWKLWSYIDGIEILDSRFDANVAHWLPKPDGNGGAVLVNATQCSRGWTIRNNEILDFKTALVAQGGNGDYCGYDHKNDPPRRVPRPTGDIVFAGNRFVNTYPLWRSGDVAVHLRGGDDQRRSLDDVTIADNLFYSADGFDACLWLDVDNEGAAPDGKIRILRNVCYGSRAVGKSIGLQIGRPKMAPFQQQSIELRDNVFAGFDRDDINLRVGYRPEHLEAQGNIFDPDARFEAFGKTFKDLEALENGGLALGGRSCAPRFVNEGAIDLRLVDDGCPPSSRP